MTVFQRFTLRVRRAPAWQRDGALIAASLVVAVLAGSLVSAGNNDTDLTAGAGPGGVVQGSTEPRSEGAAGGRATGTGAVTAADGSVESGSGAGEASSSGRVVPTISRPGTSGGSGASATAGAGGTACVSPPGTDTGVTDGQIKVAIILLNLVGPAGNQTFGIPSADIQRATYETVIKAVNASGGIACRKLVPTYYEGNPADQSQLQQNCQEIVGDKQFFVLDGGAYSAFPEYASCFPANRVPFMTGWLPGKLVQEFYPYFYSQRLDEPLYKNTIFGLEQRGFFSAANGFQKFGFTYRDCNPELYTKYIGWLKQAGLSESQIVPYNIGCPPAFAPPSVLQQAILTFRQEGVTHASEVDDNVDFPSLTIIAEQQGYRPKWGLADNAIVIEEYGTQRPDFNNIANAIAITSSRMGEAKTPGSVPSAGTAACNAIFKAAGQPPVYQQQAGFGGRVCNQLWMLKAAAEHAPALQRGALAEGLRTAGSFEASYPWGPNDFRPNSFTGPQVTYGEQYWRAAQFTRSCDCWRVIDREFHPAFQ